MYEDEVPVFRRILWFALWFIVIVAVLWFLVWLIFFRETAPKQTSTSKNKSSSHSQSASNQPAQPSSGSQPSASSGNPSNNKNSSSAAGSTPNHLANTGAGDVFIPFGIATVTGTAVYYVRLRRKLLA